MNLESDSESWNDSHAHGPLPLHAAVDLVDLAERPLLKLARVLPVRPPLGRDSTNFDYLLERLTTFDVILDILT